PAPSFSFAPFVPGAPPFFVAASFGTGCGTLPGTPVGATPALFPCGKKSNQCPYRTPAPRAISSAIVHIAFLDFAPISGIGFCSRVGSCFFALTSLGTFEKSSSGFGSNPSIESFDSTGATFFSCPSLGGWLSLPPTAAGALASLLVVAPASVDGVAVRGAGFFASNSLASATSVPIGFFAGSAVSGPLVAAFGFGGAHQNP